MVINFLPPFCSLRKVYSSDRFRSLDTLSNLYEDANRLDFYLSALINAQLCDDFIKGKKVLFKPNWVMHPSSLQDKVCLCTHEAFVLAAIEIILSEITA